MNLLTRSLGTSLVSLAAFAAAAPVNGQGPAPVISPRQAIERLGEASQRSREGFNEGSSALDAIAQRQGTRRPGGRVPTPARRPDVFVQPVVPLTSPLPELRSPGRSQATMEVRPRMPEAPTAPFMPMGSSPLLDVIPNTGAESESAANEAIRTPQPSPAVYDVDDFKRLEKHFETQRVREKQHLEAIHSSLSTLSEALQQSRRSNAHAATDPKAPSTGPSDSQTQDPSAQPPAMSPYEPPSDLRLPPAASSDISPSIRPAPERNPSTMPIDIGEPPLPPPLQRRDSGQPLPEPAPVYPIGSSPAMSGAFAPSPASPNANDGAATPEQGLTPADLMPTATLATNAAVDRVELADSLYASKQLPLALQMYRELAPSEKGEERVWIDYQIANCLRQLDERTEAESKYREVASQSAPEWVVDSARWWLGNLESQASLQSKLNAVAKQLDER